MKAAGAARTASPTMPERIERDAVANLEVADSFADLDDLAGGFVAEQGWESRNHALGAEFPIDDMQVGAADAACADPNQEFAFRGPRRGRFDYFGARRWPSLCDCFHFARPLPSFNTTSMRSASKRHFQDRRQRLFEMAQRSATIAHPRANQTVVGVLFQSMRNPA